MMDKQKEFEDMLDAQLQELNERIAQLKAGADTVMAEANTEYYKTVEAFLSAQEG